MRKASILACSLLFVAVAGFGQARSQPPLSREALAAILGLPAASSCATQSRAVHHAAKPPANVLGKSDCTGTPHQRLCCLCDQTGDCTDCCLCNGLSNCGVICGP